MSMKIFSQSVNERAQPSAINTALAACFQSLTRSASKAFVFALAACGFVIFLAVLQILVVGGMDLLGLAPQVSFLCLNVALMVLFFLLVRPALRLSGWRVWQRNLTLSEVAATHNGIFCVNTSSQAQEICKVLIIRRSAKDDRGKVKNAQAESQETWRTCHERSKRDEINFNA
jgi:hypothetical protein